MDKYWATVCNNCGARVTRLTINDGELRNVGRQWLGWRQPERRRVRDG